MKLSTLTIPKNIVLLGIIIYFVAGILGASHVGMATNSSGQMSGCPYLGMAALCKMDPLEHMAAWHNMFVALSLKDSVVLTLLLLLSIFAVFSLRDIRSTSELQLASLHRKRFRDNTYLVCKDLQEAFSRGIINPKLF